MVIKFNTTDYLTYKYIYGLDNLTALLMVQRNDVVGRMENMNRQIIQNVKQGEKRKVLIT